MVSKEIMEIKVSPEIKGITDSKVLKDFKVPLENLD